MEYSRNNHLDLVVCKPLIVHEYYFSQQVQNILFSQMPKRPCVIHLPHIYNTPSEPRIIPELDTLLTEFYQSLSE